MALERLIEIGGGLAIYTADMGDIVEQDINAQVMPPEMFERLTETIKRDGRLEQLPYGCLRKAPTDGRVQIELISGHHRKRAAHTAGLSKLHYLVDERELSRDQIIAKQLAHNKIHGASDPQVLKQLFEEIASVEGQLESYIRPEDFDGIKQLEVASFAAVEVPIDYRRVSFVLLAPDLASVERLEAIAKEMPRASDVVLVGDLAGFARFREAALKLSKAKDVRSMGSLVTMMADITLAHLEAEQAASGDGA
jgi:hypothetical protein